MASAQECSCVFSIPIALISGGVAGFSGGLLGILIGFGVGIGAYLCLCIAMGFLDYLVMSFAMRKSPDPDKDTDKEYEAGLIGTILMCTDVLLFFALPIGVIVVTVVVTNAIT